MTPRLKKNGATFEAEASGPGEAPALWRLRVYRSGGTWFVSARRHRARRPWILSLGSAVREIVRAAQRAEMEAALSRPIRRRGGAR